MSCSTLILLTSPRPPARMAPERTRVKAVPSPRRAPISASGLLDDVISEDDVRPVAIGLSQGDVEQPVLVIEVKLDALQHPRKRFGSRLQRNPQGATTDDLKLEQRSEALEIGLQHRTQGLEHLSHARLGRQVECLGRRHPGHFQGGRRPLEHEIALAGRVRVPEEATSLPVAELPRGHQLILERLQMLRLLEASRERDRALERLAEWCQVRWQGLLGGVETEEHREEHGQKIHRVGSRVTRHPRRTADVSAAITSVGTVTGHGLGCSRLFTALLEGRTAIGPVTRFPVDGLCSNLAAEAPPDEELESAASALGAVRPDDRASRLLLAAAAEALAGRELDPSPRRGVVVGTTKGAFEHLGRSGEDDLLGAPARALARAARASGPCFAISAACASSAVALGEGLGLIEDGICDEVIVGGTEALHAFVYRGFHALRALSPRPARPFDVERAGLSLGEGAAVLVLESLAHARTHGRRPIAVVEGFGTSSDGYDQVAPEPGGRGLLAASRRALSAAGVTVEDVGGYHAHGTGTIQNDRMEAAAFTALFSGREVIVSAIKGSLGHTLGAGAALDVAVCALILQRRTVPPVTNLKVVDPLAHMPAAIEAPCPLRGTRLLVASAGFGGINTALVLGIPAT
jgi:3-oxoacyl-(acyl-carrier-protein) synthase